MIGLNVKTIKTANPSHIGCKLQIMNRPSAPEANLAIRRIGNSRMMAKRPIKSFDK